ncbi:MAG: polyhydroxyalkanoate depolymerase, partial [Sphingomonas bacterium]|nr:polyhydroxyalkanoate depolymerase [Sphingomonas bacterium]
MLYDAYEVQRSLLAGAGRAASMGAGWLHNPANPWSYGAMGPIVAASLDVFAHAAAPRGKPEFGIKEVAVGRKLVAVSEEIILSKPFGRLKHFKKDGVENQPKLLIVAPMSGHFATLLRGTVERMLPKHDVFITDWHDAKLVPIEQGGFDLDDYVDYLIEFLGAIGPNSHMLAV